MLTEARVRGTFKLYWEPHFTFEKEPALSYCRHCVQRLAGYLPSRTGGSAPAQTGRKAGAVTQWLRATQKRSERRRSQPVHEGKTQDPTDTTRISNTGQRKGRRSGVRSGAQTNCSQPPLSPSTGPPSFPASSYLLESICSKSKAILARITHAFSAAAPPPCCSVWIMRSPFQQRSFQTSFYEVNDCFGSTSLH